MTELSDAEMAELSTLIDDADDLMEGFEPGNWEITRKDIDIFRAVVNALPSMFDALNKRNRDLCEADSHAKASKRTADMIEDVIAYAPNPDTNRCGCDSEWECPFHRTIRALGDL